MVMENLAESAFESVFNTHKPLIEHYFKPKDAQPPFIISAAFSVVVVALLLFLPIMLFAIGLNFSRTPISISVPLFHIAHVGLVASFVYCWMYRNMFFTIGLAAIISAFMLLTGRWLVIQSIKKAKSSAAATKISG